MNDEALLEVLYAACTAARKALEGLDDWGPSGKRHGQYNLDLATDAAALEVLHAAGLAVLSEESGLTGGSGSLLAVLDPIDGSTNAHRSIPIYSTSICVLDADGPRVAAVVNQATGVRYEGIRGGGARRDGVAISSSGCTQVSKAIVGISGFPPKHLGWAQFRAFGAASLELCSVAEGVLDAYQVIGGASLYGWDYLGGLLICEEAGGVLVDQRGDDLVVRDDSPRLPLAAATPELLDDLLSAAVSI